MHDIAAHEAVLLLGRRIGPGVARVTGFGVVVVVTPLCKVVGKFQPRCIGVGVLEIDDDELSMFICRVEKWRLPGWLEP
jgi:hypothetical protein